MKSTDWEARYQHGDTPWDKGEPSPGLVDFLRQHPALPRGSVCVPGCGTGYDVGAWTEAGFDAVGFDVAPSAVRLADQHARMSGRHGRFVQTDFLEDEPPQRFN